ncbi:MAG TPA: Ig-like domain-containing protein [Patescibacteria group bacterium]|nr:Ig-like domain-containing protein [Patescibacteria group bacterium]
MLLGFFIFPLFQTVQAIDQFDTSAMSVIGQTDLNTNSAYAKGLTGTYSIAGVGNKVYFTDYSASRTLIYNSVPTSSFTFFDSVLGQPNTSESGTNNGLSSTSVYRPRGVYSDGTRLFIADTGNNRVLIYNSIPTSNSQAPDVVLGQPDFVSNTANNGGVSAHSLSSPNYAYSDGTSLYVADTSNNRVLIWNTIPTSNSDANIVLGQPNFTSNSVNNGGVSAHSLSGPVKILQSGTKLIVSDRANNRVLIWNTLPDVSQKDANVVIGQPNTSGNTANNGGLAAHTLNVPRGIFVHEGQLYIADTGNNRVLIFDTIPSADQADADLVLGQPDMDENTANNGGIGSHSLYSPTDIVVINNKLLVADYTNYRILIWNTIPDINQKDANVVIGQTDMSSSIQNSGGSDTLGLVNSVYIYQGKMIVIDNANNRVLIWNTAPTSNTLITPDVVIGQADTSGISANYGGLSSSSLKTPQSAVVCSGKLIIADYGNSRVLIFNTFPTSNNASASVVLGQPDMFSNTVNNGGTSAHSLNYPWDVSCMDSKLIVTDTFNHRVLIWNSIPTTDQKDADTVIGQPDMSSKTSNNGGVSAHSLSYPKAAVVINGKFLVSDTFNSRVLIWNSIPTTDQKDADTVIGQPDMSENIANNGGRGSSSLSYPGFAYSDNNERLFVSDSGNNRVLGWNTFPTTDFKVADFVIGVPDFTSFEDHISSTRFREPSYMTFYNGNLYLSDNLNGRVLMIPTGPQNTSISINSPTTSRSISLSLTASDAKEMIISTNSDFSGASWETFSTSKALELPSGDGTKTVYVKYLDYANYEGSVLSASTTLDTGGPYGGISISSSTNNGYNTKRNVTLSLDASDSLTTITGMMISEDPNFVNASWETYATSKSWYLSAGDGKKTIYVRYRDSAGNETTYQSSTILDTLTTVYLTPITDWTTNDSTPYLEGQSEAGATISVTVNGVKSTKTSIVNSQGNWFWSSPVVLADGSYVFKITATDLAGNTLSTSTTIVVTNGEDIADPVIETELDSDQNDSSAPLTRNVNTLFTKIKTFIIDATDNLKNFFQACFSKLQQAFSFQ